MKRYRIISYTALALLFFVAASCVRMQKYDDPAIIARKPLNLDEISLTTATGSVACDADQLEYFVTVSKPGTPSTKAGLPDADSLERAEVSLVSYTPGKNADMSAIGGGGPATKSIYDQVTTRDLNANFLRLDEVVGPGDVATYTWQTWNNAQMLEASVIATPDNTDELYYRTVTFAPAQAYNIRTFNEELVGGLWIPKDTIFYHTRMIGWYPMICSVPVGESGDKAVIQFRDSRYSEYRAQVGSDRYGVVFDHVLDGSTDVMMSNMCEAQRWHSNFGKDNVPTPHYVDMDKTTPESQENYHFPFGHNENQPRYANPIYYHHYLSGIRLWAKVDQSGDAETAQMNLLTWGKILSVSVVHQPSTVVIALPTEVSSPVFMDEYGRLVMEGGKTKVDKSQVKFGEVQEWSDYDNMPIRTELMYGEGDINHKNDDYTASYPIDMAKEGDIHGMDAKYLGYFLVKPCEMGATKEEDETITLAIQTEGGTYQAVIPCRALVEDETTHTLEETHVFQASKVYDITLNLKTAGTFSDFIGEEGDAKYVDLSPYDETQGTYKTANSYIVPTEELSKRFTDGETDPGYTFAANIIGNGQAGILSQGSTTFHTSNAILTGVTKAAIEWQSNPEQIFNVQYQHGYIRFQMKNASPGNAVIAATDDAGKVLWSWHIWITDNPADVTINGVQFMDRNLGATWKYSGSVPSSANDKLASYGLYYQWGRKDPLPTPQIWDQNESTDIKPIYDEYGTQVTDLGAYVFDQCVSLTDAIEHPMHYALSPYSPYYQHNWLEVPIDFLWGKDDGSGIIQKSVYDPCPFGYRIVHEELQSLLENGSTSVAATNGAGLVVTNGGSRLYLPYAGFFGPDRNYTSNSDAGYFMGQKGDYTSGVICPNADSDANEYFSGHRLRTYISQATSWTSENIDGVTSFTYNAPNHYVQSSITSKRDYGNRKTAGSVRCVADGSYVHMAFAHIKSLTPSIAEGEPVYLDLNGGINLGAIQNAYVEADYPDKDGNTKFYIFQNGAQNYDFLHYLDGSATVTTTTIKGKFKFVLPNTLASDKYTFTLYVEEKDGANATETCEVRNTSVRTESMVSTVSGTNTDGKHPYAGQNFDLVVTLKAGPAEARPSVTRNDFKAGSFTATSTNVSNSSDADGFWTVTATFNNVHIDEAGLDKTLNLSGKLTMDGNEYNWSDVFHTEVWEKVGNDGPDLDHPYTSLAAAAEAEKVVIVSKSNRYLYRSSTTGNTLSLNSTYSAANNYLWKISSNGATQNLGNSNYLSITNNNVSLTSSTQLTYTTAGDNYFYVQNNGYNRRMRDNNGTLTQGNNNPTGDQYQWRICPVTEARYIDPHMTGSNWSMSGSGLHDGHPVAGKKFTATYKVTVADADAVTFTSATINGVAATGNVVKVGNNYEVTLTAEVTPSTSKKNVVFPVKVTLGVTSASLGLNNASITQYYSPTADVWKFSATSRSKGTQITSLDALVDESQVLMVNRSYNTRYTASNGDALTSKTSISPTDDTILWSVTQNGLYYNLNNLGNGKKLYVGYNGVAQFNSADNSSTDLTFGLTGNRFLIRWVGSQNSYYLRQSGNTSYTTATNTGNDRQWEFYKVVETGSYSAPTD